MKTKKNNHLLPRMVIKRWEEHNGKIYDKEKDQFRPVEQLDYSKEYYYSLGKVDDELENRISSFEAYIGIILKQLNEATDNVELSEKDMEILKLYVALQGCRNDNTSSYINYDESGIYQNNNYIFGLPLITTQDEAVGLTSLICDEFERIRKLDNKIKHNNDYQVMTFDGNHSIVNVGLHLVIVGNDSYGFLVSETTAVVECTMDGDYLFIYVPISPKIGLILAKSKYFYTKDNIENTKVRLGMKYGRCPDPYLFEVLDDKKLVFNGKIKDGKVTFKIVRLNEDEIVKLNNVIYEDGHLILFSNEDALNNAKIDNPSRKIIVD